MNRCKSTTGLSVHHIRRDGGNEISNAKVLCGPCHENTSTFGTPGESPPPFSKATREQALKNAGNRCQCTSPSGCH
jgi:5-methylcytosine-specific restriction endonuclease McrA